MNATLVLIRIGDTMGCIFESTLGEGLCFVPEAFVQVEPGGKIAVDAVAYVVSGWPRRNRFLNPSVAVHRLFPNPDAMVRDIDGPEVAEFLYRSHYIVGPSTSAA